MLFFKKHEGISESEYADLDRRLKKVEDELFVENYFYSFPGSKGTKMLPRREAQGFQRLCRNFWEKEWIEMFYTNEADYENFKALIKQWENEAIEWEKKEEPGWGDKEKKHKK